MVAHRWYAVHCEFCVCVLFFFSFLPVQQLENSVSHATAGSGRALEAGFGMAAVQQRPPGEAGDEGEGHRRANPGHNCYPNRVEVLRAQRLLMSVLLVDTHPKVQGQHLPISNKLNKKKVCKMWPDL